MKLFSDSRRTDRAPNTLVPVTHTLLWPWICAMVGFAAVRVVPSAAQNRDEIVVTPTAADRAAVLQATNVTHHATPARTPSAAAFRGADIFTAHTAGTATTGANSSEQDIVRFQGDVSYHGGPVVESAESHAVYMLPNGNCLISLCWGMPESLLENLANSTFVHVLDQYVGLETGGRYTNGQRAKVNFTPSGTPVTDVDVQTVVHSVASSMGKTGYGQIYHVFPPPGTDESFDNTLLTCYSPDKPSTFIFCAYHSSFDSDIGHLLYTVEPYQNVPGCQERPGTPNGTLIEPTTPSRTSFSKRFPIPTGTPGGTAWQAGILAKKSAMSASSLCPDLATRPYSGSATKCSPFSLNT